MGSKTTVSIKKPDKTKQPATVEIPDIETQVITLHIVGRSPLLVNNFSTKTKTELEDKRKGEVTSAGRGRAARVPKEEFDNARILDKDGRDCIYGRWIKAAIVTAAGMTQKMVPKTTVRQTVFVTDELVVIESKKPRMRTDMVRVGKWPNKQPDVRYRAEYLDWSMTFQVEFEPRMVPLPQLIYLIRRAGLNVGLCEWRPEKSGELGRFDLKMTAN